MERSARPTRASLSTRTALRLFSRRAVAHQRPGFDHPPLDTLVVAMPVSWKGTLQQYAARLRREHASKADVQIIEFVDTGHPALLRMGDKRQRGYRAMGYRIDAGTVPNASLI